MGIVLLYPDLNDVLIPASISHLYYLVDSVRNSKLSLRHPIMEYFIQGISDCYCEHKRLKQTHCPELGCRCTTMSDCFQCSKGTTPCLDGNSSSAHLPIPQRVHKWTQT